MGGMFKDTLFRSLFSDKKAFLSLYNAVSGSNYCDDTEVVINTLSETLFSNRKNDLSGLVNRRIVVLDEMQSSVNENMPFRCLSHIASIFENTVTDKSAVYRRALVKLPRPVFIVLSTGTAPYPDRTTLKLSDAFEKVEGNDSVNLELTVEVININKGRNEEIVNRCEPLKGYVEFVDTVRANQARLKKEIPSMKREAVLEKAVAQAVSYCKEHNILKNFFESLSPEEANMLTTEWNLEDAIQVAREETWGKARKEYSDMVFNVVNQAKSMDELKEMLEKSFSDVTISN
jgi:predicted regulator of amino acid metabolism with ACT domain